MLSRSSITQLLKMQRSWDSLTRAVCSWLHGLLSEGTASRSPLEKRGAAGQLLAAAGLVEGERAGETTGYNTVPEWSRSTAVGGQKVTSQGKQAQRLRKGLKRTMPHCTQTPALAASKDSIYKDHRAFMNKHFDFSSYWFYSSLFYVSSS